MREVSLTTLTSVGILGTGNMGSAIIHGLVNKGIVDPKRVNIHDTNHDTMEAIRAKLGVNADFNSNKEVVSESDIVVIAVKPQVLKEVLVDLSGEALQDKLVISVVAGVRIDAYEKITGKRFPLARVMPNTPALVNSGVSCVSFNDLVSPSRRVDCIDILGAIGSVHEVPEKYLDAVTGLSGSGPAYVFYFLEGMIDGGVRAGLPRDLARSLALDTMLGSLKLVLETDKHPMVLKDQVTSPGGTTIDALQVLEDGNLKGTLMRAIEVATKKSKALSEAFVS